ncbi:MAG TPA: ABC transporter ATP-binding protein, partial [Verrucomicrobiales bacterium]|nr:ABC transporter ATP-binding protein [Verrucomicrobiales bacterium]
WAWYGPAMQFVGALGIGLVLWFGGAQVMDGRMEVGQLMAFVLYVGMFFYEPLGKLHGLNQMLQAARAAAARVFDILDAETERMDRTARLREPVRGEVRYQEVAFGYESGREVVKGINLHASPGEMIALVGPTGAGKSTIVSLLPAFYELTSGRLTIDGQDTRNI